MRHRQRLVLPVVVALASAVVSCGEQDGLPPEVRMMRALREVEYRSEWASGGSAKLTDGAYTEPAAPGSAMQLTVRLKHPYADDLNGDGKLDCAAVLVTDPGGSGTFYDLVAVVQTEDGPRHVATTALGDRVQVEALRVSNGWVSVDLLEPAADGPLAGTSTPVKRVYRLVDREFVLSE